MDDKMTEFLNSVKDMTDSEFRDRFGLTVSESESTFYEEKRYLNGLKSITDRVNGDDDNWTEEVGNIFDFVLDNGMEVSLANDDVLNVKHENSYYELVEMHGQGCFQCITPLNEPPAQYVDFEDIVRFHETGKKPYNVNVMELVDRGLSAIESVYGSDRVEVNNEKISLSDVYEYILDKILD